MARPEPFDWIGIYERYKVGAGYRETMADSRPSIEVTGVTRRLAIEAKNINGFIRYD